MHHGIDVGSGNIDHEKETVSIPANLSCEGDVVDEIYGFAILPEDSDDLAEETILAPTYNAEDKHLQK